MQYKICFKKTYNINIVSDLACVDTFYDIIINLNIYETNKNNTEQLKIILTKNRIPTRKHKLF